MARNQEREGRKGKDSEERMARKVFALGQEIKVGGIEGEDSEVRAARKGW